MSDLVGNPEDRFSHDAAQINHGIIPYKSKDEDSTDTTCGVTVGDHWTAKQHHLKSEAKEDRWLSPGGPSNRRNNSGLTQ